VELVCNNFKHRYLEYVVSLLKWFHKDNHLKITGEGRIQGPILSCHGSKIPVKLKTLGGVMVSVLGTLINTSSAGTVLISTIGIQSSIATMTFYRTLNIR
jgi:hypothetical protein